MPVGCGDSRHPARAVYRGLLVMLVLVGSAVPSRGQDPVPRRPLGADFPVYQPALRGPERRETPPLQNPTGPLSLRDAVALALLQNPGLAAFAWETRAREARMLQAGVAPNPAVSVLMEDIGSSQTGSSIEQFVQPQATIQLSQVIELGGKRTARQQLATATRDLAGWDYETARIEVLTEVSRAFTDVVAAQETVTLTDDTGRLVDAVRQSVGARVTAGVVSPIEETRATVALANVRIESSRARRTLEASRTRLALLWGSPIAGFTTAVGALQSEPAALPSIGEISSRIEQSPELARWAAELSQREAALAVERSKAVPDVALVAGYRRFTDVDSNAFLVGASIALPFFDRNKGGIEEARSRLAKGYEEQRAARGRTVAMVTTAYAALAAARDEVLVLRNEVIPGSQQTFDAITEGYRLGKFGYLDVLDAQRTLINAGAQYLRALAEYHKAVAGIERLIGAPLHPGLPLPSISRE